MQFREDNSIFVVAGNAGYRWKTRLSWHCRTSRGCGE